MTLRYWRGLLALTVGMAASVGALANDAWTHTLGVYAVAPWIQGDVALRGIEGDVDATPGDVLDNLEGTFMAAYRGERGNFVITSDINYLKVGSKAKGLGPLGEGRLEVDGSQVFFDVTVGRKLNDLFTLFVGARYWDLDVDVELTGPLIGKRDASGSESWVDPLIGLHYMTRLSDRWQFLAKGDIGGFGVNSDFAYSATAFFAYQVSTNTNLLLGYRQVAVDYETGSGSQKLKWDVWEGGPSAGLTWTF